MRGGLSAARSVALIGVMAATLECAKLALAALPNIEVVTILLALYGYVFGLHGVAAAYVFVMIEPVIWGVGSWVISYLLYWPTVAFVFMLLGRARVRKRTTLTGAALLLTLIFSILTSLVDVGLFMGYFDRFFYRFGIYYLRGIPFYLAQLITNAVLFPILFLPAENKIKGLVKFDRKS